LTARIGPIFAGHQPAGRSAYFAFCTTASIFDETGRVSAVILGFLGCLGLRISRPPLFFGIGSPMSGINPVDLRAAVFDRNADTTPVQLVAGCCSRKQTPSAAAGRALTWCLQCGDLARRVGCRRIDILVIPPEAEEDLAAAAMVLASRSGPNERAARMLELAAADIG
jgi:hypothetical protein